MKALLVLCASVFLFSCNKAVDELIEDTVASRLAAKAQPAGEQMYLIKKGSHNCDRNGYAPVRTSELKFSVRFDSSAVYQTSIPLNQLDINKLYGFSDNGATHHQYSARFGWRWSEGALRLFAYVYNNSKVVSQELATVAIGQTVDCALRVAGEQYEFVVNGQVTRVARASTTPQGQGYMLYPYFGGDETAPQDIRIWISQG